MRWLRGIKTSYVFVFGLLGVMLALTIIPPARANACYFECGRSEYGSGVVLDGGIHITDTGNQAVTVHNFIVELQRQYNTPKPNICEAPARGQAGAAYIVRQLLGDGTSFTVTSTQWADLEARLQASNGVTIDWNYNGSSNTDGSRNTYSVRIPNDANGNSYPSYCYDPYDVTVYNSFWSGKAIKIMQGGQTALLIQHACANPAGNNWVPLKKTPSAYSLLTNITANQTTGAAGSTVVLSPTVTNSKAAASTGTQWQVSQFTAKVAYPGAGTSPLTPLKYYLNNSLTPVQTGSNASYPGNKTTPLSAVNATIPDLPVGTVICYTFSVQPRADDSTDWAHSAPVCVTIATKPLVQIWGGDLSAGKAFLGTTAAVPVANIDTSTSSKSIAGTTYTFGSWVEYGVFATGLTTNIGSAAAYAGTGPGSGLQNATTCNESYLSFHNAVTGKAVCPAGGGYSTVGNVSASRSIPDVASSFPVGGSTPQVSSTDVSTMQGVYTSAGDFTLSGTTISAGRWVVINAPGANVTITGNITYTSAALTSINDIPQLIIIAKNINIIDSVTQIDAWLIAKPSPLLADGVINTCSTVAIGAPLSSTICPKPLVVNGPVMANKLYLRRTTSPGVGIDSGNPAETFNLRSDAYLWAATHTASNGRVQTVYTTELPPRL